MKTPPDRSANAFAALAAALGITIGILPETAHAQSTSSPPAVERPSTAVQHKVESERERNAAQGIRAKQTKAEQLKAEQLKAEQLKAEQLKAEQLKAEQLKAEQLKAEQLKAEQLKAEQSKARRPNAMPQKPVRPSN